MISPHRRKFMSSSFRRDVSHETLLGEMLTMALLKAQADNWTLARLTRRLYLLERETKVNKLLLEQELLEIALDIGIKLF